MLMSSSQYIQAVNEMCCLSSPPADEVICLAQCFPTVTPIFLTTNNSPTGGNASASVALLDEASHEDQVLNHVFQQQMFPGSVVCNMKLRRAAEILCSHVRRGYGR